METVESVVAALPLFRGLKPEHVRLLGSCAEQVKYEAGEFLGREGAPADTFWLVRQGRVALENHAAGRGTLTVQTIGPDDIIGWSWLVPPHVLRFDIHAVAATRALVFDGKRLRGMFATDHEFGYEMTQRFTQIMVRRLEAMSLQLMDLYGDHDGIHE